MSFNAFRANEVLAKISEFTVFRKIYCICVNAYTFFTYISKANRAYPDKMWYSRRLHLGLHCLHHYFPINNWLNCFKRYILMSSTFNELNRYCIGFQWMNMGFVTPKLIFQSDSGPR